MPEPRDNIDKCKHCGEEDRPKGKSYCPNCERLYGRTYNKAVAYIRKKHRDEFDRVLAKMLKKEGFDIAHRR